MKAIKDERNSFLSFQLWTELFAAIVSKTESIIEVPEIWYLVPMNLKVYQDRLWKQKPNKRNKSK